MRLGTRFLLLMLIVTSLLLAGFTFTNVSGSSIISASRRVDVSPEKMLAAFRSDIDFENNYEIYVLRADREPVNPDGELVMRVTDTPSYITQVFPTIGRDCNTIVYCSTLNDMGSNPLFPDFDLFMIKMDTREVITITDTAQEREYAPSLSADMTTLTYMSGSFMKNTADLFMIRMDNLEEKILIQENLSQNVYPRVTADGSMVIYAAPAGDSKKMDIFLVQLEERLVRNLTRTPDIEEYYPDISDDMEIIVFQVQDETKTADSSDDKESATMTTGGNWQIWVMNDNNGKKQQVTYNEHHDVYPIISGDGTWVVYSSAREDLTGDKQKESMVYMTDLVTMEETIISTMPFHHDTVDISW